MSTLHLNLKKQWFDMINTGEKKEEYRAITDYWVRRLISFKEEMHAQDLDEMVCDLNKPFDQHNGPDECMDFFNVSFRNFDMAHFKNGYARNRQQAPALDVDIKNIRIDTGKPEWGAEPGKYYFVIGLGKVLPQAAKEIDS